MQPPLTQPGQRPSRLRAWLRDLILAFGVSAFVITFFYQPVHVEGTSMLPVIDDQDRLFINKIAFRVGEIHRGDVIVFQYPRDHTKNYIKRVVGLPGDTVEIDHGRVFVNNALLPEPYVPARYTDDLSQPRLTVPAHEFFVMGDHRSVSQDSRVFGTVDRSLIFGKAAFVFWPFAEAGVVR